MARIASRTAALKPGMNTIASEGLSGAVAPHPTTASDPSVGRRGSTNENLLDRCTTTEGTVPGVVGRAGVPSPASRASVPRGRGGGVHGAGGSGGGERAGAICSLPVEGDAAGGGICGGGICGSAPAAASILMVTSVASPPKSSSYPCTCSLPPRALMVMEEGGGSSGFSVTNCPRHHAAERPGQGPAIRPTYRRGGGARAGVEW